MLQSNQVYFDISKANPEKLDKRYMALNWHRDIARYVQETKQLKELLATIKTLRRRKENADRIYRDLYQLTESHFISKSEFSCFINACDSTAETLRDNFEDFKLIVDLYLEHRDFIEETPKEWIQAIIDRGASRAQSVIGENKLIEMAGSCGFTHVTSWNDFIAAPKAAARFSKNKFDIPQIHEHLGIDLNFNTQGKMLDVILKNRESYIFIEAKYLKEGGGSQDKQIHELIAILQCATANANILLAAFMDGVYSNKILNSNNLTDETARKTTKLRTQRRDIEAALAQNATSFWFNTAGFAAFVEDFA